LKTAQSRLHAAKKSVELVKRRWSLFLEFKKKTRNYRTAKDAEQHSKLLRWILQQIPLIELEIAEENMAEKSSVERDAGAQQSTKRIRPDEPDEQEDLKRQRQDNEDVAASTRNRRGSKPKESETNPSSLPLAK
jgi:hypothetical protein